MNKTYYERIGENVHPGTIIDIDGKPVEGDAGVALKKSVTAQQHLQLSAVSVKLSEDTKAMVLLSFDQIGCDSNVSAVVSCFATPPFTGTV